MSNTLLTEVYNLVHGDLPGCPPAIVNREILKTIRHFCEQTLAFEYDLDPINVVADVDEYDLDGQPSWTEIVVPKEVWLDDVEQAPGVDYSLVTKTRIAFTSAPTADSTSGLEITVALRPRMQSTVMPTRLFDDWSEVWCSGVRARLMLKRKKAWSDPQQAAIENALYWDGITAAKVDVAREGTVKDLTVTPTYPWA